jgi:hypothetical protein
MIQKMNVRNLVIMCVVTLLANIGGVGSIASADCASASVSFLGNAILWQCDNYFSVVWERAWWY